MTQFEVTRNVQSDHELTYEEIKEAIKSSLGKNLKYEITAETDNSIEVSGLEKGAPYKFDATFNIEAKDNKAKIIVNGNQKITGLFTVGLALAVVFCWMIVPLIGLVIGIVRMNSLKDMYAKKMDEVLNNTTNRLIW